MAYGRLDVFYPDGKYRSFSLEDGNVSVGRSPGNTITLETETISRYHFSIIYENETVYLLDMESQNGTYIDGVKVPKGDTRDLHGGEEILVGDLRIIYHQVDEMPTQPVRPDVDITQRVERTDVPFRLSVQPPPIAVPPSSHASAELSIENTSEEKGVYTVDVAGLEPSWVRIDRPRLIVNPGETAQVIVNVRPVRRPETAPGEYTFSIIVTDENDPTTKLEAETRITVLPYGGFGAALERKIIDGSERFRLHIHNQGSADLPLVIAGSDRIEDVAVDLVSSPNVTLQPGQRLVIQGHARPTRAKFIGRMETHPFDVVIRSQEANQFMAVVRGSVVQQPLLTPAVLAGGGVLVGLLLLGGLLLLSILFAPQPEVISMQVQSTLVARGQGLEITWEVNNVDELTLLVDETPVATDLAPETTSYTLDTTFLSASPLISLQGTTRNQSARLDQVIRVYDPMQLNTFTALPPELVRYVVQPLQLSWEVANADSVQITVKGFTGDFAGGAFAANASTDEIIGIPEDNVTVLLQAQDAFGNPYTEQIVIPAVMPQCQPNADEVVLRGGPDPRNQQIGTVPPDVTIAVDARDVTGAWVRVQLEGGLAGWGALDQFECAGSFNPGDLRQVIDVTPPPPTPLESNVTPISATATPTPAMGASVPVTPGAGATPTEDAPTLQPTTAG